MSDLSYVPPVLPSAIYAICVWRRTLLINVAKPDIVGVLLIHLLKLFMNIHQRLEHVIRLSYFFFNSDSILIRIHKIINFAGLPEESGHQFSTLVLQNRQTVFSSLLGHFRLSLPLDLLICLIALRLLFSTDYCMSLFKLFWNSSNITNLQWIYYLRMSIFKPSWLTLSGMVITISEYHVFHAYPEIMILTRCLFYHGPINDLIFLWWHLSSIRLTSAYILLM